LRFFEEDLRIGAYSTMRVELRAKKILDRVRMLRGPRPEDVQPVDLHIGVGPYS
jgi:hypothetical protein